MSAPTEQIADLSVADVNPDVPLGSAPIAPSLMLSFNLMAMQT